MAYLLQDLLYQQASLRPEKVALVDGTREVSYGELADVVRRFAKGLLTAGAKPGDRVGVFLEKRIETVVAIFGATAAGACFVPLNPLFQARHVAHILNDCDVRILVTSTARLGTLAELIIESQKLQTIVLVDGSAMPSETNKEVSDWKQVLDDGTVMLKVVSFPSMHGVPGLMGGALPGGESMWVEVKKGNDYAGTGYIRNDPATNPEFNYGDLIEYGGGSAQEKPHFVKLIRVVN